MAPVIVAKNLYKAYPGFPPVLRGANIEVQPGEMVAIMGPSGCGKSTMLHVLGMLHAPDAGELEILGQNVLALNSDQTAAFRRGNMGFVMQASNLFEHSTVFENVEFPLIYENVPPQERWERVIRALELVRLSSRVHYRSNRLSGGEQQRVAIARAMVNTPRILLADEPTGALDARTSVVIMENFRSLCHKGGVALVMVTHDPRMAGYCDSIYTLEEGVLCRKKHEPPVVSATSAAAFMKPPEPVVRGGLVAWRFPAPDDHNILELARRMHGQDLLARIYALSANELFAGQKTYSLPLVVRHMGFWQRMAGSRAAPPDAAVSARDLLRLLSPHPGFRRRWWRARALARGSVLARWCRADNIGFLYAAGARKVAFAAWVAARYTSVPFAFTVRAEDLPLLGPDCRVRARDAAFVACSTKAIADAFHKFAPDVPGEKVMVLPNPPVYAVLEDDPEAGLPPRPDKPFAIMAMSWQSNRKLFDILLASARALKKDGFSFSLVIPGKSSLAIRLKIFCSGLRKQISFAGAGDSIAESFRAADVFIGWPLAGAGNDLAMPWQLCEAMSFGKPVVALGISPGMAPLEKGRNCIEAADASALTSAIRQIASDKTLGEKLGDQAKADIRAICDFAGATRSLTDRIIEAVGLREHQKTVDKA